MCASAGRSAYPPREAVVGLDGSGVIVIVIDSIVSVICSSSEFGREIPDGMDECVAFA